MKKVLLGILIVASLSACTSTAEKEKDMAMQIKTLNETAARNEEILAQIKATNEASKEELAACNRDAVALLEQIKMIKKFEGTGVTVTKVYKGLLLTLPGDTAFNSGKATLNEGTEEILGSITKTLMAYPGTNVIIKGHTDSSGSEELNQTLSEDRAMAVSAYLMEKGIDSSRIETMGVGSSEPIDDNDTIEGKMANRRIDLTIKY